MRRVTPVVALLVLIASIMLPLRSVAAQSNGLGITPQLNLNVEPGTTYTNNLNVNNLSTSEPLNLRIKIVDFKAQDESGAPQLLTGDQPQTQWSLKPYISLPEFVTIPAKQSKQIPFTIKFPKNIGAGSYYSAVQYTAVASQNQKKVNIAASGATLIFVTVPGQAAELLNFVQFGAYDNAKDQFKSLFASQPSYFAYRLKNNGNVSESPAGSIVIKNMFGHVVGHIDNANPRSNIALIGQTRRFEVCNPKDTRSDQVGRPDNCQPLKLRPGRYTAEAVLFYGLNGQASRQISATASFWYLPLWFVAAVIIVLLIIGYGAYRLYAKATAPKHHKRHR